MTPEQARDAAAVLALQAVIDDMWEDYCPSVELIQTVRRFNGSFAKLIHHYGLMVDADGRIYSAGRYTPPEGPQSA